ncbi:flagellar hook-basal body complex protein FliE [Sulfurimonas sp. HSL-1716]
MAINNINGLSTADLLNKKSSVSQTPNTGEAFADKLKSAMNEVNDLQKDSEKAMSDIATGQVKDLHQAALAIDKAEISMKLMLEVRNKALNAYKEISRTQM